MFHSAGSKNGWCRRGPPSSCRENYRRGGRTKFGQSVRDRQNISLLGSGQRQGRCLHGIFRGVLVFSILALLASGCDHRARIVVGCKNFTEQIVLGELVAQEIENQTHIAVERRFYLGGTYIAQQSIVAGRIDVYPEYTGTALTAILKQTAGGDKKAVYERVKAEYERRFHLTLGPPLGFNDTFAIEIRGETARRLNLHTISQAAAYTPEWRAGFGYEFMERKDGYHGLVATYGLRFAAPPRIMDLGLLTRALKEHQVDLIAGNTTDGLIRPLDLFVLEDDKHYFPPYEAVCVVRQQTLAAHPEVGEALERLGGIISDEEMRQLNYEGDAEKRDVRSVVSSFLHRKGL